MNIYPFFIIFKLMDDKEYYTIMNRSNSALIIQQLQKKNNLKRTDNKKSYTEIKSRQGQADTEMLFEKNEVEGFNQE